LQIILPPRRPRKRCTWLADSQPRPDKSLVSKNALPCGANSPVSTVELIALSRAAHWGRVSTTTQWVNPLCIARGACWGRRRAWRNGQREAKNSKVRYPVFLCLPEPCLASGCYNPVQRASNIPASQSGRCDGRTIPWCTAIRDTPRRPAGFVEGNRGLPPPRRDHSATLGETGGDASSPAPA
jgi:hypothetical protein